MELIAALIMIWVFWLMVSAAWSNINGGRRPGEFRTTEEHVFGHRRKGWREMGGDND